MVNFEGYYSFPADQVESVEVYTLSTDEMPYKLKIALKSGRYLTVAYKNKAKRDGAKQILCNRIDQELRQDNIQILGKLLSIDAKTDRMEKRQLKIWRQLKQLLHIKGEIDADTQD